MRDRSNATDIQSQPQSPPPRKLDGLRFIALLKFFKATLLIATGYGVHKLLDTALVERLYNWSATLSDDRLERKLLLQALVWIEGQSARKIQLVVAITVAYTAVVLVEGLGLWFRRAWAEWLTVIATGSLVPFELWELIMRPHGRKLAVLVTLVLNVLIVWYLARLLRRNLARHPSPP